MAGLARRSPGADEAALARHAAAGDGEAFAELYERYEGRVFNLCYRILGSRDDAADATQEAFVGVLRRLPKLAGRDLAFGSYVLTSARNASYDLIERGKRAQPTEEIPEAAGPVGGGFDPGDPEDDPERNMLLEARTEEIRAANLTLPERQREVLALRELEELSYDEIAEIMDMNRNSVAQLISRARINLRDALRGTALASIAAGSPDCERALPLIALEQDGQLDEDSNEAGWLGEHLMRCHQCRLGRDAMQEAGVSYRAWLPIAAGPLLFRETMAQAAEHVGADWSETIARRDARRGAAAGAGARGAAFLHHRRRNLVAAGVLAFVLALVVLVGASSDDDPVGTVVPAAEEAPAEAAEEPAAASEKAAAEKAAARRQRRARRERIRRRRAAARAAEEPAEPVAAPPVEPVPVAPEPEAEPQRRRPRPRPRPERRNEGGGQRRPAPEVTPEPPPAPTPTVPAPPPPPPTETTPAPPPPQPPPPSCTPSPNCPPPPGP